MLEQGFQDRFQVRFRIILEVYIARCRLKQSITDSYNFIQAIWKLDENLSILTTHKRAARSILDGTGATTHIG